MRFQNTVRFFFSELGSFKVKSNIPLVDQAEIVKQIWIINSNPLGGVQMQEHFLRAVPCLSPPKMLRLISSQHVSVSFLIYCLHRLFINELHSSGSTWES